MSASSLRVELPYLGGYPKHLAAFGINVGLAAIIASALIVAWIMRTRSRGEVEASGGGDG
jgi:hypothetical protein